MERLLLILIMFKIGIVNNILKNSNGVLCYSYLYKEDEIKDKIIINKKEYNIKTYDYVRIENSFIILFVLIENIEEIKINNYVYIFMEECSSGKRLDC